MENGGEWGPDLAGWLNRLLARHVEANRSKNLGKTGARGERKTMPYEA
jgi:hypothetical protein